MDDFLHSHEAENVLDLFYDANVIVYVEGADDIPFWQLIFDKLSNLETEIIDVGGSLELRKYSEDVTNNNINAVIACDSDFEILKGISGSCNIIRTYGYSIENSLICEKTIESILKNLAKLSTKNSPKKVISKWMAIFFESVKNLIYYDIYNELNQKGTSIVGDNCSKFLTTKNSFIICDDKIDSFLKSLDFNLTQSNLDDIDKLTGAVPREINDYIRGHFLFSAVATLISSIIKQNGKKISFSNDSFFTSLLLAFENTFTSKHPHYNHYNNAIKSIQLSA